MVAVEGAQGDDTLGWAEVEATESDLDVEAAWRAVEPEDLITLIYTSGTTGPPKGVQLVHRNLMAATRGVEPLIRFPDGSKVISWLPSAHIAERMAHHYLPIVYAMTITTCPNPREVVGYLPAVKPTWFFAVPRIWEKLKAGMEGFLASGEDGEQKRALLDAAMRKVELEQAGEPVPDDLAATVAEADEKLFSQIRAMLGFDQIAAVNVGAAPTPREVLVFFHAIGVPLAELWGMSETCGAGACNPPEKIKIGTVGPPTPGVEARLGEDGELLIRSDVVMTGYRNLPDKTAEALDADGWLHTGDIATIDDDGYITIVDRKKELIISAAGKNMSPANIESPAQGRQPADRPGVHDRRRPLLQHRADRARRRLRARLGDAERARGQGPGGARARGRDPRGGPGRGRQGQRQALARGADQEVHDPRGRLGAGRRRAHADDEAQAQADRGEVRRRDRGDVLGLSGPVTER